MTCCLLCVAALGCGGTNAPRPLTTVLDAEVHLVSKPASPTGIGATVLLLHGASYSTEVWDDTGIATALHDAGISVVAADLPGFGHSTKTSARDGDMLRAIIDTVGRDTPLFVVSPSMSGRFSLALLASDGAASMAGFVPIAPVGIESFVAAIDKPVDVPALIVWGANDDVIDVSAAPALATAFVQAEITILPDAGHAAYVDQSEAFVEALVAFIHGTRS